MSSKIVLKYANICKGLFFAVSRVIYVLMSTFFDNISRLLAKRGEKRSDLIRGIDIPEPTVRSWQTKTPSVEAALKVARYFGVSIEYLLEEHDADTREAPGFYGRILLLCEKKHISTRELCERVGVSEGTFYSWAHSLPDAQTAYRVAHALRTSVEYLVTGEGENSYGADTELVEIFRALDARDRAAVMQLAQMLERSGGYDDNCASVSVTVANSDSKI